MRCERDINPVIHHLEWISGEPSSIHHVAKFKWRGDKLRIQRKVTLCQTCLCYPCKASTLTIPLFIFILSFTFMRERTIRFLTDSLFTSEICRTLFTSNLFPLSFPFRFSCHFHCATFFKIDSNSYQFILKRVFCNKQVGVAVTLLYLESSEAQFGCQLHHKLLTENCRAIPHSIQVDAGNVSPWSHNRFLLNLFLLDE
jgi:hypothetical protein